MIDPPPWTECLPTPPSHGYVQSASVEVRMRMAERSDILEQTS